MKTIEVHGRGAGKQDHNAVALYRAIMSAEEGATFVVLTPTEQRLLTLTTIATVTGEDVL